MEEENDIYQPPSEVEMKIIQTRRERSDKISKLMAQYLLKGYKMLSSSCESCGVSVTRGSTSFIKNGILLRGC